MDKTYNHKHHEEKIYKLWEKTGAFRASQSGEPYTILMPPPNANASLHAGHAMYTIDDIVIRWKRMQGYSALWQPGMDHAGFETQYVFEKHLKKQGKSRMDFDRATLYKEIFDFVQENSGLIFEQFKKLGFSADWERSVFTLDDHVIAYVYETFEKMFHDGYVYRDKYIVNYCVYCGTSLAELEVKHVEREDTLYYVRYPLVDRKKDEPEFVEVATVRPEPIYSDTHLAIHPKNKKTTWLKDRKVLNPVTNSSMEIIEDEFVDPKFGTGIVKLTPAHDHNDFEVARKHNLPIIQAINNLGRMTGGPYKGEKVLVAREKTVEDLKNKKLINEKDTKKDYEHSVATCYRCGHDLEPLVVPNWFIKVDRLKESVKKVVREDSVNFIPSRYKKHMLSWLDIMHDWPISRQIVWGIRIPVWYKVTGHETQIFVSFVNKDGKQEMGTVDQLIKDRKHTVDEIRKGIQQIKVDLHEKEANNPQFVISKEMPVDEFEWLPETDTFDTWFSSSQWPLTTLNSKEKGLRLPTNFIGTLADILKFWISRMILLSLYKEDKIPFKDVYLWSMVADKHGVKMSKSKGNVINPIDLVEKYGADALRMSLVFGIPAGSKVILSDDKVRGMRNFANKIWNMARFMNLMLEEVNEKSLRLSKNTTKKLKPEDKEILKKLDDTLKTVNLSLEKYRFSDAADVIYHFVWQELASSYLEEIKKRDDKEISLAVFRHAYINSLKLLHPFMPFVTEAIWQEIRMDDEEKMLISSSWPTALK